MRFEVARVGGADGETSSRIQSEAECAAKLARTILFLVLLGLVLGCQREATVPLTPQARTVAASTPAWPNEPTPEGMVAVPGGRVTVGSENGLPTERPTFDAQVAPFFMDKYPVTVARFRTFVETTGHQTDAERFGDAGVLGENGQWTLVPGATWQHPQGPNAPAAGDDHPVTQVSWKDAVAFCAWEGKRLPTEVEWEHAARNGKDDPDPYAWGQSLTEGGKHRANTWQGTFPVRNTMEDGYRYTSPVGTFGATELGLTDMGGNVWEWTADWFRSYADREKAYTPTPQSEKVQRGGSFLCHDSYCHGYRVSARSHSTPETALFHVGFRCVQDAVG